MSQAKTQLVKNYGLTSTSNSTSSSSSNPANSHDDENNWLSSPSNSSSLIRPSNTSDSSSNNNWSMPIAKQSASSSNNSGSGKEQLWSSDSSSSSSSLLLTQNHNHQAHIGQEENYLQQHHNHHNHHQHNNTTSSNQHSQPGNYLKSIQNTSWNHLTNNHTNNSNNDNTSSSSASNGGMCMNNSSPNNNEQQQHQQRNFSNTSGSNNNNSINNSNQNDLINTDTWSLFSSAPIIGNSAAAAAAISSSSSSSSTNMFSSANANSINSSDNLHNLQNQQHGFGNANHQAWSNTIQNGWDSGAANQSSNAATNGTGNNMNEWQMNASNSSANPPNANNSGNSAGQASNNANQNSNQSSGSTANASNSNTSAISLNKTNSNPSSSSSTTGGATLPTVPASSAATATSSSAPSSRSWAKIVSQQSSPSAASLPTGANAGGASTGGASSSNTNASGANNASHSASSQHGNSSSANQQHQNLSNFSFNANQTNQMLNHNNSQTTSMNLKNNDSSSSHDMSASDMNNSNEMSAGAGNANSNAGGPPINYEWNIKVNQTVPWSIDSNNDSAKGSFNKNMNMMQAAPVVNSVGTTASTLSTTSSSSSSSSIGNEITMKPALMSQPSQGGKSLADTGTEIWIGANANKIMPMGSGWGDSPSAMGGANAPATTSSTPQTSSSPTSAPSSANNWSPTGKSAAAGPNANEMMKMMKWPTGDQQMLNNMNTKNDFAAMGASAESANSGSQWGSANQKPPSSWMNASAASSSGSSTNNGSVGNANEPGRWMQSGSSSPSLQQQQQQQQSSSTNPVTPSSAPIPFALKGPIEPSGWDDPDFKTIKKSDDGTNIWGDPESHKQMKVQKWSYYTKHMPNPQALKAALTDTEQFQSSSESPLGQPMSQSMLPNPPMGGMPASTGAASVVGANPAMMMGANPSGSSPTSTTPISNMGAGVPNPQQAQGWSTGNSSKMQQPIGQSQWTNTPAAPSSFLNENSRNSPNFNPQNDWTIGLVDTTSWSTKDQSKNNFDPSVGVIDTSKWSSSNPGPNSGNGSPGFLNQQSMGPGGLGPMNPGTKLNPNMNGLANPGSEWSANIFNNRNDDSMENRHKSGRMITGNNPLGNQALMNAGGLQRMTSVGNNVPGFNNPMNPGFNTQLSQPNSKNFAPSQTPFSAQNLNLNTNMMLNTNTNNMAMMAGLNQGNTSNSPLSSATATPQIQNQLIESFKLAVQAGLISSDLLNTKLPQDVLTLLYQLFQTLNHYMNSNNKLGNLQKRRNQMNAPQFKQESDNLNQEILLFKETLLTLQGKINSAHMLLKQQAGNTANAKANPIQPSSSSTNIGSVSLAPTPPGSAMGNSNFMSNLSGLNATGADIELFSSNPLKDTAQKPKLLQLLSENPNGSAPGSNKISSNPAISRQASQPAKLGSMNQNFFHSFGSNAPGSFSNNSSQWSDGSPFEQLPPLDDRITPFVPGQLWTGQGHSSIEDDPNCTPGSVSKPILTETFDPESILREHRNSQWSTSLSSNDSLLLGSGLGGNQFNSLLSSGNGSKTVRGGSWSSNGGNSNGNMGFSTQMSLQNQNPLLSGNGNSSSIGEQLWGVKSNNRVGGGGGNGNGSAAGGPNMNRNSASFNNANNGNGNSNNGNSMLHQQQQQQFYRSNSWNVTPQQQQQQHQLSNSQDNRSSNTNNAQLNNGHFVLIKNVQPQIDQSTLRALCAQHASGTLTYYRYIPQMTCVIVRYNSKEEANNAQSKLNSITLNNAQLFTQPLNENELKFLFSM